jgi:hypothetical protein
MLRRFFIGLLWAVPGYLLGAFGGGYLLYLTSSNTHDRSVEAAMTGAFLFGPLVALVGFVVGAMRAGPRPPPSPGEAP